MAKIFTFQHTDFPQQLADTSILLDQIATAQYSAALQYVRSDPVMPTGFTITVEFVADITGPEAITLAAQIAAHDPTDPQQIRPPSQYVQPLTPESFGAWGDGVRLDHAALQAAIDQAAAQGGGTVALRPGQTYGIASTLILKAGVVLDIPPLARILMLADVTALEFRAGARCHHRGTIDASAIPYTSALVLFDGVQRFNKGDGTALVGGGLLLGDDQPVPVPTPTGTAVKLHAHTNANDHITWIRLDVEIHGFEHGVWAHCEVPGAGGCWINANDLRAEIAHCVRYWRLEGSGRNTSNPITGNRIRGSAQPHIGRPYSERALYCGGSYNDIRLTVWDWSDDVNDVATLQSTEFSDTSSGNRLVSNVPPTAIIDDTALGTETNRILTLSEFAPTIFGMAAPPAIDRPTYLGDQHDILAAAWQLYTVTQTAGPAPSAGQINDAFTTAPNTGPRWNGLAVPVTIEIDFGASLPSFFAAGANFGQTLFPRSVDIEFWNGSAWIALHSSSANLRRDIFAHFEASGVNGVERLRITMSDPAASDVWLTRLWAFSASKPGRAFVRQERVLRATSNWAPGSIASGQTVELVLPLDGAETTDTVLGVAVAPGGFPSSIIPWAIVPAANFVTLRLRNTGTVPAAAPTGTYAASLLKP